MSTLLYKCYRSLHPPQSHDMGATTLTSCRQSQNLGIGRDLLKHQSEVILLFGGEREMTNGAMMEMFSLKVN